MVSLGEAVTPGNGRRGASLGEEQEPVRVGLEQEQEKATEAAAIAPTQGGTT